jgi:hypothetical protein
VRSLDEIPGSRDLWIVEPPSISDEAPPGKKVLVYPITICYSVIAGEAVAVPDNAERRLEDDADGRSGRRREDGSHSRGQSRSRSADAGGGQAEPTDVGDRRRRLVHERLGRAARGSGGTPRGGLLGSLRPLDVVPEEPTGRALGSSASPPMPPMAF